MSKTDQPAVPLLFTVDSSARAIYHRFRGWPDVLLTAPVLTELVRDPSQLDQATQAQLIQRNLLQPADGQWLFRLPVWEQLPTADWASRLRAAGQDYQDTLLSATRQLAAQWPERHGVPVWPEIAHSLLLGFVWWGCGSRLLLRETGMEVLAVVVGAVGAAAGVWHGFVRANPEFGVSTLLTGAWPESQRVHRLLQRPEVGQALQTMAADGSLLALHPHAIRVLQRLGGLASAQADERGLHHIGWPVITPAQLAACQPELQRLLAAIRLLIRSVLCPQLSLLGPQHPHLQPGDLGLVLYALVGQWLAESWEQAKLLPARVPPSLGDLS